MRDSARRGMALVMVMAFLILFATMATFFVFTASVFVKNSGWEQVDHQVFWIAEAGLQKAIWNLKTPVPSGGQGELWPEPLLTVTVVEALGIGNYTMVVEPWDYALAATGATAASAPPAGGGTVPGNAIDGNPATFWQSGANPTNGNPQDLIITFPYAITLNRVRFLAASNQTLPRDYIWAVSPDNATWTPVVNVIGNNNVDSDLVYPQPPPALGGPKDVFAAQSNVRFLRLRVTRPGNAGNPVQIIALNVIGRRITSTGRITTGGVTIARTVRQTVVTDDALPQSQVAYYQPDWTEQ